MVDEAPPPPPPPQGGNDAPARPDYIEEKFWDAEKGAPNVEGLAKSYSELQTKLSKGKDALRAEVEADRFKNRPEKPEAYAFVPPKEGPLAKMFEGLTVVDKVPEKPEAGKSYLIVDEKDPLMGFWRKHAHDNGLGPEEFSAGVAVFAQSMMARNKATPSEDQMRAAVAKSYDTLGEHGVKRVEHVKGQLQAIVGEEGLKALDFDFLPASAVATIEKVLEKAGGVKFSSGDGAASGPPMTRAQLMELQASKEYRDGDPTVRQKVADGWKALAPGDYRSGVV